MNEALVVLSGGQDSTTCLYWALSKFEKVRTVTFDYGQRHRAELASAQKISEIAGVPTQVLPINTFNALGGNALTGAEDVKTQLNSNGLPNTFVPGRNLIFLTFAAAYAYQYKIQNLVTGICQTDYSGYPDCRQNTVSALELAVNLGMESQIKIHTPLMWMTKAETILLAQELGALDALSWSHTCYNGAFPPCGQCPACQLRAKGFQEAGIPDPLFSRKS
ncbi:7-cyano-7-deazaguanine synthase QueC [Deltaproteobacteria bacterium TL4]